MDPCGEHFTIVSGAARAAVSEVGAGLRYFAVGDTLYTEPVPDGSRPPRGSGALLAPWPNRVAGGRWSWEGRAQQLALSEPEAGNAIHGLLRQSFWRPADQTDAAVTLTATVAPQNGWPQPVTVAVTYRVGDEGLTVETTATNEGSGPIPFGLGFHPYLRIGDTPTDDCTLTLAARAALPLTDQLPSGPLEPLSSSEFPLGGTTLDSAFGDCEPTDGLVRHRLTAPDGNGVELWADPAFGWVQVFTPSDMPQHGRAVAVEPMTCPPDALNSGTDLVRLEPGDRWTGSWGLRPLSGSY
ncbi:aldose 1-epimerase family protein [Pseudonocardia xishanensis]|uniref:Aldose 1-epimerase family protein n=1 Tax=Pseudonocardia xishanensis TaxID=630995 RepID=A0ABP8S0C0_9PSEU